MQSGDKITHPMSCGMSLMGTKPTLTLQFLMSAIEKFFVHKRAVKQFSSKVWRVKAKGKVQVCLRGVIRPDHPKNML